MPIYRCLNHPNVNMAIPNGRSQASSASCPFYLAPSPEPLPLGPKLTRHDTIQPQLLGPAERLLWSGRGSTAVEVRRRHSEVAEVWSDVHFGFRAPS